MIIVATEFRSTRRIETKLFSPRGPPDDTLNFQNRLVSRDGSDHAEISDILLWKRWSRICRDKKADGHIDFWTSFYSGWVSNIRYRRGELRHSGIEFPPERFGGVIFNTEIPNRTSVQLETSKWRLLEDESCPEWYEKDPTICVSGLLLIDWVDMVEISSKAPMRDGCGEFWDGPHRDGSSKSW